MNEPGGNPTIDAEALYLDLRRAVASLCGADTRLAGIATGGAWLAQRLHTDLGRAGAIGVISTSMHRDDYARRGLAAGTKTRLPYEIDGADILLIDDVLYTGRTIRAALNELFDFGRPASVRLVVLVDRGGRELPVAADHASLRVDLPEGKLLELEQDQAGGLGFVLQDAPPGRVRRA
jgi:pyrimidine operon attenuation protein/uracil phosphoribosyltransferase